MARIPLCSPAEVLPFAFLVSNFRLWKTSNFTSLLPVRSVSVPRVHARVSSEYLEKSRACMHMRIMKSRSRARKTRDHAHARQSESLRQRTERDQIDGQIAIAEQRAKFSCSRTLVKIVGQTARDRLHSRREQLPIVLRLQFGRLDVRTRIERVRLHLGISADQSR